MYGGVYRLPPQPVQQTPHVPIGNQGDAPPRRTHAAMLALVLASWPTGLEHAPTQLRRSAATMPQPQPALLKQPLSIRMAWEPPDPPPQRTPQNVAPLTLTYGDQPPPRARAQPVLESWRPADPVQQHAIQVVPPPPVENAPPPTSRALLLSLLRAAWEPGPPQPQPEQRRIAPLTLVYGSQPPPRSLHGLLSILRAAWEPGPPQPQRDPKTVAPLLLTYGAQPPPRSLPQPFQGPWWLVDPPPQRALLTTPAPPIDVPPPRQMGPLLLVLKLAWEPPPPQPQPEQRRVAPLTLTYGQQPPPLASPVTARVVRDAHEPPEPIRQRQTQLVPIPVVDMPPPRINPALLHLVVRSWYADPFPRQRPTTLPLTNVVTGTGSPTVVTQGSTGLGVWQNPDRIKVADDSVSHVDLSAGTPSSETLIATGFGLTVPTDSVVHGILIEIRVAATDPANTNFVARLTKNGTTGVGSAQSILIGGTSLAYASVGGQFSLFSATWTTEEVSAATFGVRLFAVTDAAVETVQLDHVRITVWYTPPAVEPEPPEPEPTPRQHAVIYWTPPADHATVMWTRPTDHPSVAWTPPEDHPEVNWTEED